MAAKKSTRLKTISIRFNEDGSIKSLTGGLSTAKELAAAAQFGLAFRKAAAADTRSGAMGEGKASPVLGLFGDLPLEMHESLSASLNAAVAPQPRESASVEAMEANAAHVDAEAGK